MSSGPDRSARVPTRDPPVGRDVLVIQIVALAATYWVAARLGLMLDAVSGFAALVWPASGIALAVLLFFGVRLWPGIFLGAMLANLTAGASFPSAAMIGVGNTLEAVIGAFLLLSIPDFRLRLDRLKDAVGLVVLAALGSTLTSPTIGVAGLWLGGHVADADLLVAWRAWWLGDLIGDLVVAPPLLLLFTATARETATGMPRRTWIEGLLLGVVLLAVGFDIFLRVPSELTAPYLLFPLFIWAAVRFGLAGTSFVTLAVTVIAVGGTALDHGPFVRPTLHESLFALQQFMAVTAATFVVLGAAISERARVVSDLRIAQGHLEQRVEERTSDLQKATRTLREQEAALTSAHAVLEERVTERTQEIQALSGALQSIVAAAPIAIVAVDDAQKLTMWNPAAETLFGRTARDVVGRTLRQVLGDDASWPDELARTLAGQSIHGLDLQWSVPDRATRDVRLSTAPLHTPEGKVGVMAVIADVTEQNKLVEERRHLASIVESSLEAIVAWTLDGEVTSWNSGAVQLFGYTAEESIGKRIMDLIIPPGRLLEFTHARERLILGQTNETFETQRRRKDGTLLDVSISISPLKNSRGRLVGGSTIARDITERKRAEDERAHLLEQLGEAVNARDALISIASHELRTPLTALQLQIQLLARHHPDSQVIPQLVAQTGRLGRLINNLLEVSRMTAGTLQLERSEVDLVRVVHDAVQHYRTESRSVPSMEVHAQGPVIGWWDPMRLDQIVHNLISNAIKYGAGHPIEVRIETVGQMASLFVIDRGIGIAPADQSRVFERFERLVSEREVSGFGLGLWIVRQIVDAFDGTISVVSSPGVGSTFRVDLPLALPTEKATTPPEEVASG